MEMLPQLRRGLGRVQQKELNTGDLKGLKDLFI